MNISLTPQLEQLIKRRVDGGLYASASEVVREALRLLEQRDRASDVEQLRRDVRIGLDQIERGEIVELNDDRLDALGEQVKADGRVRLNDAKRSA